MDFARETLFDVIEEVDPLLRAHHEEVTVRRDLVALEVQWHEYQLLEQIGRYVVFTARVEGELAGYAAFFFSRHMHHAHLAVAVCDVLYLMPQHRRGTAALHFIDFAERALTDLGANKITISVPMSQDWRPILHRKGYSDEEVVCGKFLRGE